MAPSPSYGDRPPLGSYRRSFTTPARVLSHHERAGLDPSDAAADVLYSHPRVKIVRFTPPTDGLSSSEPISHDTDYPVDAVETLPWASAMEEPLSNGQLRIEKVQGSTNFLKSGGSVNFPLMRNSQCWLVDGEAKFVLRVGKLQYYRIELPKTNEQETAKVEELKAVLGRVSRYEKTPCPFKRGFHVELPEDAMTPRRKGQWKRRESSLPATPTSDVPPLIRGKSGRTWKPQTPTNGVPNHDDTSDVRTDSGYEESLAERKIFAERRDGTPSSEDDREMLEESEAQEDVEAEEHIFAEEFTPEHDERADMTHNESEAKEEYPQKSPADVDELIEISQSEHEAIMPTFNESQEDDGEEKPLDELEGEPRETRAISSVVGRGNEERDSEANREEESTEARVSGSVTNNEPEALPVFEKQAEQTVMEVDGEEDSNKIRAAEPGTIIVQEALPVIERQNVQTIIEAERVEEPTEIPAAELVTESVQESLPGVETEHEEEPYRADTSIPAISSDVAQEDEQETPHPAEGRPDDSLSIRPSVDSLHILASPEERLPVSQQSAEADFDKTPVGEPLDPFSTMTATHKRDPSEITMTPSLTDSADIQDNDEEPSTRSPSAPHSGSEERPSTPSQNYTHDDEMSPPGTFPLSPSTSNDTRWRAHSQHSLPPLLAVRNVFVPPQQALQGSHLTGAILRKVISKPVEYAVMLVHVFARIVGGATVNDLMSGELFRTPEPSPVRRRYATPSAYQVETRSGNATDEDDFGMPLRVRHRAAVDSKAETDSLLDVD